MQVQSERSSASKWSKTASQKQRDFEPMWTVLGQSRWSCYDWHLWTVLIQNFQTFMIIAYRGVCIDPIPKLTVICIKVGGQNNGTSSQRGLSWVKVDGLVSTDTYGRSTLANYSVH